LWNCVSNMRTQENIHEKLSVLSQNAVTGV